MVVVRVSLFLLLLTAFASFASAQHPVQLQPLLSAKCTTGPSVTYPTPGPDAYPLISTQYAVKYELGNKPWTQATVYQSEYGGTYSSPWRSDSGYALPDGNTATSMSFVSIPVGSSAVLSLSISSLAFGPFVPTDSVSVRPSVAGILPQIDGNGNVQILVETGANFNGEQFILWWNRSKSVRAGMQALVFFLNPNYQPPTEPDPSVAKIVFQAQLDNLVIGPSVHTLDIEGMISIPGVYPTPTGGAVTIPGAGVWNLPEQIDSIYLGENAWVQGKLRFAPNSKTMPQRIRKISGPGVLDVSRFQYDLRVCKSGSGFENQGYNALSSTDTVLDYMHLEGIIIVDTNHAATDALKDSVVKNVKTLGWNGVNGGLRLSDTTTVSNVFVRSGDDSLMVWGKDVKITTATVWQNYNGGVVNLGWSSNSSGDGCEIDGLYVVKTDWIDPDNPDNTEPGEVPPGSWTVDGRYNKRNKPIPGFDLNNQNNAVFASLMIPTTQFGVHQTPLFQNIFIDETPQVLFSLKILPPECGLRGLHNTCPKVDQVDLMAPATATTVDLKIHNLYTPFPASRVQNSIGFETLDNYINTSDGKPLSSNPYTLQGFMNISLMNVFVDGQDLTTSNGPSLGMVMTNGANVNIQYNPVHVLPPPPCKPTTCP